MFLDLEQEAAAERGGPPPLPPGGPVWRERQEDWNDTDTVLAQLASTGPSVTDYEEPSSDDPFAYDFLDLDDDSSWLRDEGVGPKGSAPLVTAPATPEERLAVPTVPPEVQSSTRRIFRLLVQNPPATRSRSYPERLGEDMSHDGAARGRPRPRPW